jgi:hypothetical protein
MNNKIKALVTVVGFLLTLTLISLGVKYYAEIMGYIIVGSALILCLWIAYNIALEYYNSKDKFNNN